LWVGAGQAALAARFHPVVSNFVMREVAPQAGTQNWDIDQDANGNIFVANNRGMLVFDGYNWELMSLPGNQSLRSVMVDGDSIFVGGYEEFGYFKRNEFGRYHYHSLKSLLKHAMMENEDFWKILRFDGNVYFQSFETAYSYDGKKITRILPSGFHPLFMFRQGDSELYIQEADGDFYRFEGENQHPRLLFSRQQLGGSTVVSALREADGATLLFTEYAGIFRLKPSGEVTPVATVVDDRLKSSQVNRGAMMADSLMVVGTIRDGVYVLTRDGRFRWHLSADNGLNNNTVLRLMTDHSNNIWVALDNGVSLIHAGIPLEVMGPARSEMQIGMVYDVAVRQDGIFLPTNQSLFYWDAASGQLSAVDGTNGQNWYVTHLGATTFVGNNSKTMLLQGRSVVPIDRNVGGSTCVREAKINGHHIAIESSYSAVRIYLEENGNWHFSHNVEGIMAPIRQLEVSSSGTIWASNINRGIIRFNLDNTLTKAVNVREFQSLDGENSANYIMKILGSIAISDSKKLYVYDELSDSIRPFDKLNEALFTTADIHSATDAGGGRFWLSARDNYFLIECAKNEYKVVRHIPVNLLGMENNEGNDRVKIYGDYAYMNLNNGIARIELDAAASSRFHPELKLAYAIDVEGETVRYLPIEQVGETSVEGNVVFRFNYPDFSGEFIRFRFTLRSNGKDVSEHLQDTPEMHYASLAAGKYTLHVDAIDSSGMVLNRAEYSFKVPRPWFASVWAILMYILLFLGGVLIVSKQISDRAVAKRRKEFEMERDKQNIRMLEQEKLIAEQKRLMLEAELSEKGKEIAQMALNVFSREQVINNLKESLSSQRESEGISRRQMSDLLSKIKSDMSDIEFWHIYQKNIDLIHEHFFRNLRERYPSLTHSDLRFCALLRLNLSTKDIAKFTNLSVRGVETARYRLRRKFGISSETSLVNFLIDFK
jgi:DNA-binding CsgD family transcriptional regulator/outer membrane protein assembly factor BamB